MTHTWPISTTGAGTGTQRRRRSTARCSSRSGARSPGRAGEMRPEDLYSELKVAHHPERIKEMRERRPVRPVELQLMISDLCNQDCRWCAYRASDGLSVQRFGERRLDGTVNH